jgi:hypothetical protein
MKSIPKNLESITNSILELEKKYNLLDLKIDNVFVWQASRSVIYLSLLDSLLPNNSISGKIKTSLLRFLKRNFRNVILKNPFLDFEKSDTLIFRSSRKYSIDEECFDIYTKYLCDDLGSKGVKYKEYDGSGLDSIYKDKEDTAKQLGFIYLMSKIKSKFINVKFETVDLKMILEIENEIKRVLGVSLNIRHVFEKEIIKFKSQYPLYKLLFKIKQAKHVYLINSANKTALIKAAKDCNVLVSELQHGLISKEGLIANYPFTKEDSLDYFPNNFYIWDNLNMYTSKLPLSEKNIFKFPNKHLEYLVQKNKNIKRVNNQILVVSQPYNSKEILNYISTNLSDLKEWKIIYKIHPAENFNHFMITMKPLLLKFDNLILVNKDVSIYDLFSESRYVIGNFSTSVFEAPLFGCKVLLLDLPGVEMSEPLIVAGKSSLVKMGEPLSYHLK